MSNQQYNTVDRIFREKLGNARSAPPADMWSRISNELVEAPAELKKGSSWLWISVAASVALVLGLGWFYFSGPLSTANPGTPIAESLYPGPSAAPDNNQKSTFLTDVEDAPEGSNKEVPIRSGPGQPPTPIAGNEGQMNPVPAPNIAQHSPIIDSSATQIPGNKVEITQEDGPRNSFPVPAPRNSKPFLENNKDVPQDYHSPMFPEQGLPADDPIVWEFADPYATPTNRWKISGQFSPEYTLASNEGFLFQNTGTDLTLAEASSEKTNALENVRQVTSFSTGVRVGYAINEHVELQSGLDYAMRAGEAEAFHRESHSTQTKSYNMGFIEVPVAVKYNLRPRKKINFYVRSGVSTGMMVNYEESFGESPVGPNPNWATASMEHKEEKETGRAWEDSNYNTKASTGAVGKEKRVSRLEEGSGVPAQVNLTLGTGMELALNDNLSLNLEPGLRYTAFSNYVYARPLSASLNSGLTVRF